MSILQAYLHRRWAKQDKRDAIVTTLKVLTVDRIRHLGKSYLSEQEISLEDKETLKEMFQAYKSLGGNGDLDTIMEEVSRLPVVEN